MTSIISWNVNGIRAIYKKGFIDTFTTHDPDILCIQETKAQKDQLPKKLLDVTGYHLFMSSAQRKGYSGVATYSKGEPLEVLHDFGTQDKEGRILILVYDSYYLLNIYFPNGKASKERLEYKLQFYDECLGFCEDLLSKRKKVIVCGDVNTAHTENDIARPKENEKISGFLPIERMWIDKFLSIGFDDSFRLFDNSKDTYSWWDYKTRARERNVGWRIDYFFTSTNLREKVRSSSVLVDVMGSDHCPIVLNVGD